MMEGAMKAMFWVKIKIAAAVFAAVAAVGGAGGTVAVKLAAGEPAPEPPKVESAAAEKGIECQVTAIIPGGKVMLSAGSAQGVREKFEFEVSRDGKKVGEVKAVAVEEKQSTAEVTSVTGELCRPPFVPQIIVLKTSSGMFRAQLDSSTTVAPLLNFTRPTPKSSTPYVAGSQLPIPATCRPLRVPMGL